MPSDFDNNLLDYFTDVEHLRGIFKDYVAASILPKRMLVIHGVGGVGKSSLLRMFRIHCKSEKIPVALASGDDAKSAFDIITRWMDDLKADGVKFPSLSKTIETYRAIQAKVDEQAKKTQNTSSRMADIASKAASKTAETAGGALLGAAIGSVVPGVGTAIGGALGGVLSGMGAEALTDWLRGFLSKPDIDLLLDPAKRLATDFLVDIAKAAEKKRIVLLLDTYEQMTALEDWVGEITQTIHPNILMVIAGRKLPDGNRAWQGWIMNAHVEELRPMTEDIMRQLIRRYYSTMRGGEPNPEQVEAIIHFARGLPMVVTSAVQLWVKYGVEDFQAIKPEIVANLVDRLMEGVPKTLIPVLEAAAVVRWFDQPILRAVTGLTDVRDLYDELRRFPFVRTRVEGLALHDAIREIMDENLRVQDSERHHELHKRAASFIDGWLNRLNAIPGLSDEWQKLTLEKSYHLLLSDENAGSDFLQTSFGQGLTYFRYQFCKQLINDTELATLSEKRTLHRIKFNKIRLVTAEFSPAYVDKDEFDQIISNSNIDPLTKWQVLLSYAGFIGYTTTKSELEADYCKQSLDALKSIGQEETGVGCLVLKEVARWYYDEPSESEKLLFRALKISEKIGAPFFAYEPYIELGHLYLAQRKFTEAETMWKAAVKIGESFQNDSMIANALNRLAHAYMALGELDNAEKVLMTAIETAKRLPDTLGAGRDKEMYIKRHLGILYQMRGEYEKAIKYYSESAQIYRERKSIGGRTRTLVLFAGCLYEANRQDMLISIRSEIEEVIPKLGLHEVVAGWMVILGHIAIDDAMKDDQSLNNGIEMYKESMKAALRGPVPVMDEILNRIFWKLNLISKAGYNKFVPIILNALLEFWLIGKYEDKPFEKIEIEMRKKFLGSKDDGGLGLIENQIRDAIEKGVPNQKPSHWNAY